MPDKKVTGFPDIIIDDTRLEAKISFKVRPDGREWNKDQLLRFAAEKGIKEGIDSEALENFLLEASKKTASEDYTFVIAKGTPPVAPEKEEIKWEKFEIPERLLKYSRMVLSNAPKPEIKQIKTEKKKVEKIIKKKAILPFLPPTEEKKVIMEKIQKEETVSIDPSVKFTGWAVEGATLAEIYPGTPGKPGKDISGRQIPPSSDSSQSIYPGKGIERKKNVLTAVFSGFLRVGADWADIIPFKEHSWEITFSRDRSTSFLSFIPGNKEAEIPDIDEIIKKASQNAGSEKFILSKQEIETLILESIKTGEPISRKSLSLDDDSFFDIEISRDNLKAVLNIHKGRGSGKQLSLKELGAAIKNSGLSKLNMEKIKTDILEFYKSSSIDLKNYILAEGLSPGTGSRENTVLEIDLLDEKSVKKIKDQQISDKTIPSLDEFPVQGVESMAPVKEGQSIGKIGKLKKGKSGRDIFGNSVSGENEERSDVVLLENIKEVSGSIIPEITGILDIYEKGGIKYLRIRPHEDSYIDVTSSPDDMEAWITLKEKKGTALPLQLEKIKSLIKEKGIVKGIDFDAISSYMDMARKGETVHKKLFAKGTPAQNGRPSEIQFCNLDTKKQKNSTSEPIIIKRGAKIPVKAGTVIARIPPLKMKPADGWTIKGDPLPSVVEKEATLIAGDNVKTEKSDAGEILYIAEKNGELSFDGTTLNVKSKLILEGDLTSRNTNIRFPGSVDISGNVQSGQVVFAGGDLFVREGIEAALLSTDTSIYINLGIKGGGKAILRAKKDINTSFAEEAHLLSVGNINIKNTCFKCLVKCNGKVSLESDKGNIVGGKIYARQGIEAMNIGNENGIKTELHFGQDFLIMDQIQVQEREIHKLKENILKIDILMKQLEKNSNKTMLDKIRHKKLYFLKIINKRSRQLFLLREKFEEHFPSGVKIRGTVFPGVSVGCHGRNLELEKSYSNIQIKFNLNSGRIEIK